MPLFRDKTDIDGTRVVIWEVSEQHDFFKEGLQLSHGEREFVKTLNNKRQLEWMASRYLMQKVMDIDIEAKLRKDKFGKPYLLQKDVHISISHSHKYSALATSPKIIGIDIQLQLDKITRIAHKFINEKESTYITEEERIEYMHVIWGAKESMYKAYGRKRVEFIEDMELDKFIFAEEGFTFAGRLIKDKTYNYDLKAEKFDDYHFVIAKELS